MERCDRTFYGKKGEFFGAQLYNYPPNRRRPEKIVRYYPHHHLHQWVSAILKWLRVGVLIFSEHGGHRAFSKIAISFLFHFQNQRFYPFRFLIKNLPPSRWRNQPGGLM
jgi:hypothetical protein